MSHTFFASSSIFLKSWNSTLYHHGSSRDLNTDASQGSIAVTRSIKVTLSIVKSGKIKWIIMIKIQIVLIDTFIDFMLSIELNIINH